MVRLLGGLCADEGDGDLEIVQGVYYRRDELPDLKYYYDKSYLFDPKHIGVVLGETRVSFGGKIRVVQSVDHGNYTLEGQKSTITQWELLETRCDEEGTLDADLRRFIPHLVTKYTVMMGSVVPFTEASSVTNGMRWNYNDALDRARGRGDKTDPESGMKIGELIAMKERVDTLRDLSLAIFTTVPVDDTLPENFWSAEKDESLHEFAKKPGSLSQLNFLGGLGCVANDDVVQGCLFSGDIVRGGHTLAPPVAHIRGSWEEKLKGVSKLLTCAYRLGRPVNLLEAYHPLCLQESQLLPRHHSQWSGNIAHSLKTLNVRDTRSADAVDNELQVEKSYALRFAQARSKTYVQALPPVVVVGCGIRDAAIYGRVGLHSLDTTAFSHARGGSPLLEHVLGTDASSGAVQRILDHCLAFFRNARKLRAHVEAKTNGGVGDGNKIRKMRVVLVEDTPEKREKIMRMFMEGMSRNGCQRLMEAIETIDPDFVEWGLCRLEEAKTASTTFEELDGEKHLLGDTPEKVDEGEKRVSKLLKALEKADYTSKDIVVFSVATALASLFNGANLRPQDSYHLDARTTYYLPAFERMMIRLPEEGKQTATAEQELSTVCMEHGVEGADVVRWWMVMSLVGRPFLKKGNNGELGTEFRPLGVDGKVISEGVFDAIVEKIGEAYFGLGNVDINALRTAQDTLAVEHIMELGLTTEATCISELAREQRTSKKNVCNIYNARIVDAKTVTTKFEGIVSFKGGMRRMIEERHHRLNAESDTLSEDPDVEFEKVEKKLKLTKMKLELRRAEEELKALDAGGASAVSGTAAGAIPLSAGETKPRVLKQGPGSRGNYKPKPPRETTQAERDGVKEMRDAVLAAFERATARGSKDPLFVYMAGKCQRTSRLALVRFLQKTDPEYQPGTWFEGSKYFTHKGLEGFRDLVDLVQSQLEDFEWGAWREM